jgi:hypothetical protein
LTEKEKGKRYTIMALDANREKQFQQNLGSSRVENKLGQTGSIKTYILFYSNAIYQYVLIYDKLSLFNYIHKTKQFKMNGSQDEYTHDTQCDPCQVLRKLSFSLHVLVCFLYW